MCINIKHSWSVTGLAEDLHNISTKSKKWLYLNVWHSVAVYLTLPRPLADRGTHIYRCTHSRWVEAFGSRGFTFQIRQDRNHQTCQLHFGTGTRDRAAYRRLRGTLPASADGIKLLFLTFQPQISSCSTCLLCCDQRCHVNSCLFFVSWLLVSWV